MWRHHLRLALRSLARDRMNATLGGLSLAVAVAACVLIALFVRHELGYNRGLPGADQLSMITAITNWGGERSPTTSTPSDLASALADQSTAIEAVTKTRAFGAVVPVLDRSDDAEVRLAVGDSLFFEVFAYPFLHGDPQTALDRPDGAVLTVSAAQRLFGTTDAIGQPLQLGGRDTLSYVVRGVVVDPPKATSIPFEAVGSFAAWRAKNPNVGTGWGSLMYHTYARRHAEADPTDVQAAVDAVTPEEHHAEFVNVPLTEFRLSEFSYVTEGFGGDPTFVKLFSAVALLILVLGGINYVNLATARGARRAKEIGVRKALGSGRGALVRQFLTESVVLSVLAAGAGLALATLALPFFNATFALELSLGALDVPFLLGLATAAVGVGLLAGLYPAVYLSGFEPVRVLRGGGAPAAEAGEAFLARTWLRRGLVVFQFAAAVLLLAGTGSVLRQLAFHRSVPLGFEPEEVVVVPITSRELVGQSTVVKRAFERVPGVVAVAGVSDAPPVFRTGMAVPPDPERPDLDLSFKAVDADADADDVLGFTMAAGRWIEDTPADAARSVVVNEAFADALGWTPHEAVGREVNVSLDTLDVIVGVVRDFHHESLREPVGAVAFASARIDALGNEAGNGTSYPRLAVRLAPGSEEEAVDGLRRAYAELAGEAAFEPAYLADEMEALAADEVRLAQTLGLFAFVAVLIAALGLVGLAAYTAERRTKEVGIRRALGASTAGVVALLSREYVALVAVAAALAAPVTVLMVRRWLEGFAYHAPFSPFVVAGATALALALAAVSVGAQALRAARRDPVRALRSE